MDWSWQVSRPPLLPHSGFSRSLGKHKNVNFIVSLGRKKKTWKNSRNTHETPSQFSHHYRFTVPLSIVPPNTQMIKHKLQSHKIYLKTIFNQNEFSQFIGSKIGIVMLIVPNLENFPFLNSGTPSKVFSKIGRFLRTTHQDHTQNVPVGDLRPEQNLRRYPGISRCQLLWPPWPPQGKRARQRWRPRHCVMTTRR